MLEGTPAFSIVRDRLAAAAQNVLVGEQPFQADGAASVEFAVADTHFGAQTIAEAVSKGGGSVVEHAGGMHFAQEGFRGFVVAGEDAFCMARTIVVNVLDGFGEVAYDPDCNFQVAVFGAPVFFRRGDNVLAGKECDRTGAA